MAKKPAKGRPNLVLGDLKKRVALFARRNRKIFIGKTSGKSGLEERYANKYKALGYKKPVAIYQTSSDGNASEVEDELIDYARLKYIEDKLGMDAKLFYYCTPEISLENVLLIAK